ncbi:MAG: PAS domain S-box protein [Nitrospirales bacterium]
MSIRKLSGIFYIVNAVLLSLLAVLAVLLFLGQRELEHTHAARHDSYLLADQLRQSSDDLTRMARTYVVTGDPRFEDMYWKILAIRNGEAPRPLHYDRIYWDLVLDDPDFRPEQDGVTISLRALMKRLGFTQAEFAKLAEAEEESNELVQRELTAINAMKGLFRDSTGEFTVTAAPDPALAIRLLHDETYHQAKGAIMRPVNAFYEMVGTRTDEAVAAASHRANRYLTAVLVLFGFILIVLVFSYVIMRKARVAEHALRHSEERTRLIVERAFDAIVVMDDRGLITGWNPQAEKLFGWSRGEAVGRRLADTIIPPQHRDALERGLSTFLKTGEGPILNRLIEITALYRDGSEFPVELAISTLPLEGDWTFTAFIRDIRIRKRSEAAREEQARLASLGADIGMALTRAGTMRQGLQNSAEAFVRHMDVAFARIWTLNDTTNVLELEASAGLYTHMNGPHGRVPVGQFKIGRIAQRGQPHLSNDVPHDPEVSDPAWAVREGMVAFAGYPLKIEGRVVGVVAAFGRTPFSALILETFASVSIQIAQFIVRKGAEGQLLKAMKEIQASHWENEKILTALTGILIGVNEKDEIIRWNSTAEKVFELAETDVLHTHLMELNLVWDWKLITQKIYEARNKRKTTRVETLTLTCRDGRKRKLDLSIAPLFHTSESSPSEKEGFLILGADITEKHDLEAQLALAQKMESIGQLAAGMAHEINTPLQYIRDNLRFLQESFTALNSVLTATQSLATPASDTASPTANLQHLITTAQNADLAYLSEEMPQAFQQSLEGAERVTKIVRAMKEFSHPGSEEKKPVDLNHALKTTITVARNEWKYVAEVEEQFDATLPLVPGLPGELNQVFLNLLVNAAQAIAEVIPPGTGQKGRIIVRTEQKDEWAEIQIQDTGPGIPEAIRQRIFDPFFTTKDVGKGTGQGLALAHTVITKNHQGTIELYSEMGLGTTFVLKLPL